MTETVPDILVVGGAGYIGSILVNFVNYLKAEGYSFVTMTDLFSLLKKDIAKILTKLNRNLPALKIPKIASESIFIAALGSFLIIK